MIIKNTDLSVVFGLQQSVQSKFFKSYQSCQHVLFRLGSFVYLSLHHSRASTPKSSDFLLPPSRVKQLTRNFRVSFRIRFCRICCPNRTHNFCPRRRFRCMRLSSDNDAKLRVLPSDHMCSSAGHIMSYAYIND